MKQPGHELGTSKGTKAFKKHLITELMSNIGQVWTYHCKKLISDIFL